MKEIAGILTQEMNGEQALIFPRRAAGICMSPVIVQQEMCGLLSSDGHFFEDPVFLLTKTFFRCNGRQKNVSSTLHQNRHRSYALSMIPS